MQLNRKSPFKNERPGKKWYYLFLKRHPELSKRTPEGISKGRAVVTEEVIRKWFRDLHNFLTTENSEDILEDPARIFNLDETSFSLAPKTGCVLAPKGTKNVYQVKFGNEKETLTVLLTFAAIGEMLPPMIVYPYVRPPKALVENMPDNWALGRSEKGWMTAETFYEYIKNNFNTWLQEKKVRRPILLFLDGHKSHMSIQLHEFCSKNEILLYCLPPNTTHILQPADVGAFKELKSDYKLSVLEWQSKPENLHKSVTKLNFCTLLKNVIDKSDRIECIKNSFKKCGLFPFNPDAVDYSRCIQNILEDLNETRTQLSTVPSYECFEAAKEVISFVRENLVQENINPESVLRIITEAQKFVPFENSGSNTEILEIDDDAVGTYIVDNNTGELRKISADISPDLFTSSTSQNTCIPPRQETVDSILELSPGDSICIHVTQTTSTFDELLPIPKPFPQNATVTKEKFPMCISSHAWKEHYNKKEAEKLKKREEIQRRKAERVKKRTLQKPKPKREKLNKTKHGNSLHVKISCMTCDEEFDTDVEDENLRNIGCDNCENWFHLKCTSLAGLSFTEAEKGNFICNYCDH